MAALIKQKCLASECHLAAGQERATFSERRSTNRCPSSYLQPANLPHSSLELLNCCQCLFGKTKLIFTRFED